jgi:hypothetical protein
MMWKIFTHSQAFVNQRRLPMVRCRDVQGHFSEASGG